MEDQINIQSSSLYSEDLAPVPQNKRTWNTGNYAALWISMSLCIPTYMLASSLIGGGMNWWQAILTIFLGNAIVLIPLILNGHAGAKYGIPFPVFARSSFGVRGANIAAMLRAIVACGWFGIQTWIGGFAIYQMLRLWIPAIEKLPQIFPSSFGLQTGPAITFFLFWLVNMFVIYLGVESIRKLLVFKAFFLPIAALALLAWAIYVVHGLGPILDEPSKFTDKFVVSIAMIAVAIATLATNIAANMVSPANDFANLSPSKISFRTGGYITGVIGIFIFPWKLIADPTGYIFTWLVGYSSLLGPVGGIMIADYYFIRKQQLNTIELYKSKGIYTYSNGFNKAAVIALLSGILPNIPGFLITIKVMPANAVPVWVGHLYNYAWFVGFFVSGIIYFFMMKKERIGYDKKDKLFINQNDKVILNIE